MLYDLSLRIAYDYAGSAEASRHLVRLMPAELPGEQRAIAGTLTVTPKPQEWTERFDFFGNRCTELFLEDPHEEVSFSVSARVDRFRSVPGLDISPPLPALRHEVAAWRGVAPDSPHHYTAASVRVPLYARTADFARDSAPAGASTFETVKAINLALNDHMRFDAEATDVDTPLIEAFERRVGVCQDMAHIMISALRGIGVPAGYVSGYLRTNPPPGEPRLEGADAMHAWVRAWCGREMGWVEFDPTNAVLAGEDHIVVARARDYSDVAPVKGVMRSTGDQTSKQAVDVVPLA